jgi:hypothetical protein
MITQTKFQKSDKVVCVSTHLEHSQFGARPMELKLGALYVVQAVFEYSARGQCLHVGPDGQYSADHFRLVSRQ